jgi:hypothetical protein
MTGVIWPHLGGGSQSARITDIAQWSAINQQQYFKIRAPCGFRVRGRYSTLAHNVKLPSVLRKQQGLHRFLGGGGVGWGGGAGGGLGGGQFVDFPDENRKKQID